MKPVVFLGPSLAIQEARDLLDADYRAPAGQGDLFRAALERPPAIALIDGVFRNAPTVRHREILWALSRGIPVYGAASMGALRAAELSGQGMIGAGLIFRWYRRYALLPDDAVAVTHTPAALGSQPLSDALVDIRRSLSAARRRGLIDAARHDALRNTEIAKPFPDRIIPAEARAAKVSQKAADARTLLQVLAQNVERKAWPHLRIAPPAIVHAWIDDLADSGLDLPHDDKS